jgi:hypothetical protein
MSLTPDEKDALTALEHHLCEDDPTLAAELARGSRPPCLSGAHILLARRVALLWVPRSYWPRSREARARRNRGQGLASPSDG